MDNCSCWKNKNSFKLIGNFNKLEEVITEIKSSDYSISFCKKCIDTNYSKSTIKDNDTLFIRLQNAIKKRLHFVIRNKK